MAQQFKDAAVILSGLVISNEVKADRETGAVTGRKIAVLATVDGEAGLYNVNVSKDDMRVFDPTAGSEQVTIWVRSAAYSVDGNSGMSTKFIREVADEDLETLSKRIESSRALAGAASSK